MRTFALTFLAAFGLIFQAAAQDVAKPVKLVTVEAQNGDSTRQFFGQAAARQTVDLAFQVDGQIVKIEAVEGAIIPKGEVIAELDLEPFELALRQARLEQDQADRAVERYRQLQGGAVSQVTLDDAITAAELAAVAVRNAEYSLEHATLYAPYDALVAERIVQNFTTITAGTAIVRLHDMSELRIEIDVPEVLFQQAGKDPDVTVTATFPASDEAFPLEVREFNAETSSVGQTFQLTFGLTPPEDLRILPGSSVTVTVNLHGDQSRPSVPATALVPDEDGALSAMVFEPGEGDTGTLRRAPVEVEPLPSGHMAILSGLDIGAEIVAMGARSLEDGQLVRRFVDFGQ